MISTSAIDSTYRADAIHIGANDRVARALRLAYSVTKKEQGLTAWETPRIYSLSVWLRATWASEWPQELLLYPVQEYGLWVRAVDKSGIAGRLQSALGAARDAVECHRALKRHSIDLSAQSLLHEDESVMAGWASAVELEMRANAWLSAEAIPEVLTDWYRQRRIAPPSLVLHGFTEIPRALQRMFEGIVSAGGTVEHARPGTQQVPTAIIRPRDIMHEAQWASTQVAQWLLPCAAEPARAPRIGIIVPSLDDYLQPLERALRAKLCPRSQYGRDDRLLTPWRVAPGQDLVRHPVAVAALRIVALADHAVAPSAVSAFLLQPYGGLRRHAEGLARIDYKLRDLPEQRRDALSLASLAEYLDVPDLAALLRDLSALRDQQASRQLPSVWSQFIRAALNLMLWPVGEKSSEQFQAEQQVLLAIDTLAALDAQADPIGLDRALVYLREILARPFQASVNHEQPIEIVTYTDAPGIPFEHVLVLGCSSRALPFPMLRLPFVARERLAEAGAMLATAEGAMEHAQHWLEAVLAMPRQSVAVSCPAHDATGNELAVSNVGLLRRLPRMEAPASPTGEPKTQVPAVDPAPPWIPPPDGVLPKAG